MNKIGTSPTFDLKDSFFYDGANLVDLDAILNATRSGASFEPQAINADGTITGYVYGGGYPVHAFLH